MTSMNVSLPEQMKNWVELRIGSGQYHNASEYVRELIRKDQEKHQQNEAFKAAIEHGRNSGLDDRAFSEIIASSKEKAKRSSNET